MALVTKTLAQELYEKQQFFDNFKNLDQNMMANNQSLLDAMNYARSAQGLAAGAKKVDMNKKHLDAIAYRLRIPEGQHAGLDFLDLHITPDVAFVFVVKGKQAVVLEDDPALFPSDKLVGELLLMIG